MLRPSAAVRTIWLEPFTVAVHPAGTPCYRVQMKLNNLGLTAPPEVAPGAADQFQGVDDEADFISVVLADTEDTWNALFERHGRGVDTAP